MKREDFAPQWGFYQRRPRIWLRAALQSRLQLSVVYSNPFTCPSSLAANCTLTGMLSFERTRKAQKTEPQKDRGSRLDSLPQGVLVGLVVEGVLLTALLRAEGSGRIRPTAETSAMLLLLLRSALLPLSSGVEVVDADGALVLLHLLQLTRGGVVAPLVDGARSGMAIGVEGGRGEAGGDVSGVLNHVLPAVDAGVRVVGGVVADAMLPAREGRVVGDGDGGGGAQVVPLPIAAHVLDPEAERELSDLPDVALQTEAEERTGLSVVSGGGQAAGTLRSGVGRADLAVEPAIGGWREVDDSEEREGRDHEEPL